MHIQGENTTNKTNIPIHKLDVKKHIVSEWNSIWWLNAICKIA